MIINAIYVVVPSKLDRTPRLEIQQRGVHSRLVGSLELLVEFENLQLGLVHLGLGLHQAEAAAQTAAALAGDSGGKICSSPLPDLGSGQSHLQPDWSASMSRLDPRHCYASNVMP